MPRPLTSGRMSGTGAARLNSTRPLMLPVAGVAGVCAAGRDTPAVAATTSTAAVRRARAGIVSEPVEELAGHERAVAHAAAIAFVVLHGQPGNEVALHVVAHGHFGTPDRRVPARGTPAGKRAGDGREGQAVEPRRGKH